MLLEVCASVSAGLFAITTIIAFTGTSLLCERRTLAARATRFRQLGTRLDLRELTEAHALAYAGTHNGRDIVVAQRSSRQGRRRRGADRVTIWVALRTDVLQGATQGATFDPAPPAPTFHIHGHSHTPDAKQVRSLLTPDILQAAAGLQDLQLQAKAQHIPNGTYDAIYREAWGSPWQGATLTATLPATAGPKAIRNTLDHLAKVATALEATSQKTP